MNATPHDIDSELRQRLARFLRARREAMPPPRGVAGRRRTPGLRREEVAQHAGISTAWYTWLEQGRDIALSAEALARLAEVLALTPAERRYLFELARRRDPHPPGDAGAEAAPAALLAAVQALPMPAYLLDRHWRRLAWNAAAAQLFAPWADSGEPCLLRYTFLDASARRFIADWDARATRLVAEFRADTALHPDDAGLLALVEQLCGASADFAARWHRQDVLAREGGRRDFVHPAWGAVAYEQLTLVPAGHADHKLVMLLPWPAGAGAP